MKYKDVQNYLTNFRNEEPIYDVVGGLFLLKAIIGNLSKNLNDFDLQEYNDILNEEEIGFLKKLIKK